MSQHPRNSSASLRVTRHSAFTAHSQRLTPLEVAQHWFRRGRDFAGMIHSTYRDFPRPAPDGLYLRSQVEDFFLRLHGIKAAEDRSPDAEQDEMLKVARGH